MPAWTRINDTTSKHTHIHTKTTLPANSEWPCHKMIQEEWQFDLLYIYIFPHLIILKMNMTEIMIYNFVWLISAYYDKLIYQGHLLRKGHI